MTEDKPWLSLPDEEPPERGLAELMAAARVQADVMSRQTEAPAPWWKRMFEVLRRPPVLALATILVLFGGVIVVGRHPDQVQAPAPEAIPAVAPVVQPPPPLATPPGEAMAVPQAVAPADPPKHVEKKPTAVTSRPIEKAAPEETAHERAAIEQTITDRKAAASGGAVQLAAPESATAVHDDDESPAPTGVVGAPVLKGASGQTTIRAPPGLAAICGSPAPSRTSAPVSGALAATASRSATLLGADQVTPLSVERITSAAAVWVPFVAVVIRVNRLTSVPFGSTTISLPRVWPCVPGS